MEDVQVYRHSVPLGYTFLLVDEYNTLASIYTACIYIYIFFHEREIPS